MIPTLTLLFTLHMIDIWVTGIIAVLDPVHGAIEAELERRDAER